MNHLKDELKQLIIFNSTNSINAVIWYICHLNWNMIPCRSVVNKSDISGPPNNFGKTTVFFLKKIKRFGEFIL